MPVSVLIADDHELLRAGLKALLERQGITVVGEAGDGRSAVLMARELRPAVVIMDVSMPHMNGIDATTRVLEAVPDTRVLALSMHADRRFVMQILDAGASGYLLKDSAVEELGLAVRTLAGGQVYLSPGIAGAVIDTFLKRSPGAQPLKSTALSTREREVLQLIAEGRPTADIAADLHVSVKTVESHRKNIMDKLALRSVAELTKFAIREGLTGLGD
ncbi:MAG: response regulator transcription factor [Gammaproteobacteria bacterium]|nr:response regulator transcription factor [Gammaproteobacteria bacterium]